MRKKGQTEWRPLAPPIEAVDRLAIDDSAKQDVKALFAQYAGIEVQVMHVGVGTLQKWGLAQKRADILDRKACKDESKALGEAYPQDLFREHKLKVFKEQMQMCLKAVRFPDGTELQGEAAIEEIERMGAEQLAVQAIEAVQTLKDIDIFTQGPSDSPAK